MKKKNIGICIITTTLLMGSHAKATELVLTQRNKKEIPTKGIS